MLVLSRKDGASSRGSPRGRDDRGSSAAKGIAGIAGLLVALSLGLTSVPSPVADLSLTAASTPPRHTDSPIVDVQDLETSPAFLDDFSVYSYGKVATNGSGAAVLFWNAMSSGVFVARTWDDGALSPSVAQPPIVLFSETPAGGGLVATNLTMNQFANLDVKVRGDRAYLSWVLGAPMVPRVGFTWVDLSSVANVAEYAAWHSANGQTPPARGAAWDRQGVDLLPYTSTAPSVVATRDGRIVIASQQAPTLWLDVLYYDGASWRSGRVYTSGYVGEPHLEIDDQDDLRLVFHDQSLNAILYATCPLGSQGLDPTLPGSWKKASGVAGFDAVVARSGTPLYSRSYLTVDGDEVRVGALSDDKSTFYFNVLRNGTWLGGTGVSLSGWSVPQASSQARYPYTFFQWSRDASGESYLFFEKGGSVLSTAWNGSAWSSPLALGTGSYRNVIGQLASRIPGDPLLVFSRDASANKLVLFALPTRAPSPDLQGPVVGPGSLNLVPDAFVAPADVTLNATLDDRSAGGTPIAGAEFFLDAPGASGSGTAMLPSVPPAFRTSNLTSVVWTGTMDAAFGGHTIWVHGLDAAGNWGPFSSVAFTVLEPAGPTSSLAASWLGWTSVAEADIGFTASAEAGLISLSLWARFSTDNATFGPWASSATVPASGTSYNGSGRISLTDGPGWYEVRSVAKDTLDRTESLAAKVSSSLGYDGSAPSGSVTRDGYWSLAASLTLNLSATDDADLVRANLFLSSSTDNASFSSWALAGDWTLGGRTWTEPWSASPEEGYHRVALVVVDESGRTYNAARNVSLAFGIDIAPPESRWTAPLPAYPGASWTASYEVQDSLGVAKASLLVSRSADNVTWSPWQVEGNATILATVRQGSFTVFSGILEGWVRVSVVAVDFAGRTSAATSLNVGEVPVDLIAPQVEIGNLTLGAWIRPSHRALVSASESASLEYRFEGLTSWSAVPPSGEVSFAGVPDGTQVLSVRAQDRAWNLGTASASVQVDGHAPVLASCEDPYTYVEGRLTVCWTASDVPSGIASLGLLLDGASNPLSPVATEWSGAVEPGSHLVEVTAVDRAGNAATLPLELSLDGPTSGPEDGAAPLLLFATPFLLGLGMTGAGLAWFWWSSRRK